MKQPIIMERRMAELFIKRWNYEIDKYGYINVVVIKSLLGLEPIFTDILYGTTSRIDFDDFVDVSNNRHLCGLILPPCEEL